MLSRITREHLKGYTASAYTCKSTGTHYLSFPLKSAVTRGHVTECMHAILFVVANGKARARRRGNSPPAPARRRAAGPCGPGARRAAAAPAAAAARRAAPAARAPPPPLGTSSARRSRAPGPACAPRSPSAGQVRTVVDAPRFPITIRTSVEPLEQNYQRTAGLEPATVVLCVNSNDSSVKH